MAGLRGRYTLALDGREPVSMVFRVSAEEITLIRPSNYGPEEVKIQAEEIQKIEIQSASKSGEVFTSTVGVIGLGLSAIFLLFLIGGDISGTG